MTSSHRDVEIAKVLVAERFRHGWSISDLFVLCGREVSVARLMALESGLVPFPAWELSMMCAGLELDTGSVLTGVQSTLISMAVWGEAGHVPTGLPTIEISLDLLITAADPALTPVMAMLKVSTGYEPGASSSMSVTGTMVRVFANLCGLSELDCWQRFASAILTPEPSAAPDGTG